jgi:hypothetical protein
VNTIAFLNQIGRGASIFIGITAPKPEHERRFGILIVLSTIFLTAGTVVLFFAMTRMLLR